MARWVSSTRPFVKQDVDNSSFDLVTYSNSITTVYFFSYIYISSYKPYYVSLF